MIADNHRAYKTVANKHKMPLRQMLIGKHTSGGYILGHIDGYHHNIRGFISEALTNIFAYVMIRITLCTAYKSTVQTEQTVIDMSWSRVAQVTVESYIRGTVVAITDSWVFFYFLARKTDLIVSLYQKILNIHTYLVP